ncbi:beta-galactosidase [Luteimicrobium xylanilyticum]|uniref:Beta-galactosidase n=1 Tax=Luteimicrobium xylanilyticum TaxID=1133546 RepID=A0A5P9Q6V4_9MICO|nr:beta-galactosidase [Luteimicrobium xylanilyticum]QFU97144.1 Beta-galactosidase [Luteimicrobium xylanilyticum]
MTSPVQHRWLRWPATDGTSSSGTGGGRARIAYGADYNPEQWPREVWADDARLMREAGVNIVTLAVFSWAKLQPTADTWDFAWLDEVMDLMHANGIAVDLATATASPPPWLTTAHPEILPVNERGETLWPGARQHWRPTSPVFREHALRLVEAMAARYADHPALAAWHVSNELGCHNVYDYSDDAAAAFRAWLRDRYKTSDALNDAWGTSFWSQWYGSFDEVLPPRLAASYPNPTQQLDFKRFSSDALRDYLRAEADVLRRITPDVPVTTNFMLMGDMSGMNYADWAAELDFVANDHYRQAVPRSDDELSLSANLTSGVAGGRPWYLMEHATSAVNWQRINAVKSTALLRHDALTHLAHGADAVCFFQWRQSASGAEKFHSGMVPHAGPDSELFRGVVGLGRTLQDLAPVAGSGRLQSPVAVLVDWDSWWASELDSHPSNVLRYRQEALDWYGALLDAGVRADAVPVGSDLSGYRLVVAPVLYLVPEETRVRLHDYVEGGGHLVLTYFSGIADADDRVYLGGYPGAFRDLLGVRVEEFVPLLDDETVTLSTGATGTLWSEPVRLTDPATEVLASYLDGSVAGGPAVTRRVVGEGSASYVSTRLGVDGLATVLPALLAGAGVTSELPEPVRGAVEHVVRTNGTDDFVFYVNRTAGQITLPDVTGELLLGERADDGTVTLEAHGVAVLRTPHP